MNERVENLLSEATVALQEIAQSQRQSSRRIYQAGWGTHYDLDSIVYISNVLEGQYAKDADFTINIGVRLLDRPVVVLFDTFDRGTLPADWIEFLKDVGQPKPHLGALVRAAHADLVQAWRG